MAFEFKTADIAACWVPLRSRRQWGEKVIQAWCSSPFAPRGLRYAPCHVAIIAPYDGQPAWFEATTLSPHRCLIRRKRVSGMQCHDPLARVFDYTSLGGRVDLFRLTRFNELTPPRSFTLAENAAWACRQGIDYDYRGALFAGTRIVKRTSIILSRDVLERVFCSEILMALLQASHLANRDLPTRYHPAAMMRALVNQGTYRFEHRFTAGGDEPAEQRRAAA